MDMFPFSSAPTQAVILPSGRTATVRVVRGDEPPAPGPFLLNTWMMRVALVRLTRPLRTSRWIDWRVEVESSAIAGGYWAHNTATREQADALAERVLESLRRTGELPALPG